MALDQSALLDFMSDVLHADSGNPMALLLQRMLQELIDAEATAVIGAGREVVQELGRGDGVQLDDVGVIAG